MSKMIQEEMNRYADQLKILKEEDLLEEVHRARVAQRNVYRLGKTRAIGKCYAANLELQNRYGVEAEKKYQDRFGDVSRRSAGWSLAEGLRSG
jgi:hypothetical protein